MVVYVQDQIIDIIKLEPLVSNTVNEYTVEFIFDKASWDGYEIVAVFRQHMTGLRIDVPVNIVENMEEASTFNGKCIIPWDVLNSDNGIYIGVYGMKDGHRKPTVYTIRIEVHEGTSLNGHTSSYVRTIYEESIWKTKNNAELSDMYARDAEEAADRAREYSKSGPKIVDGYWYVYDADEGEYVNTGVKAEGSDAEKYTAGENIFISDENVISASDSFKDITDFISDEDNGKVLTIVNAHPQFKDISPIIINNQFYSSFTPNDIISAIIEGRQILLSYNTGDIYSLIHSTKHSDNDYRLKFTDSDIEFISVGFEEPYQRESIMWTISTPYTQGIVDGDTVRFESFELNWSPADSSIGRWQDGYWIGLMITSPDIVTADNIQNVIYSNDNGITWKSFNNAKDSGDTYPAYMYIWLPILPSYVEDFLERESVMHWNYMFAWDGNKENAQHFEITADPSNVTLIKDGTVEIKTIDGVVVERN